MAKGDFHLHSTASDGVRSPSWVIGAAAAKGVRVLSLTDHDTTAGLAEAGAAAGRLGLRLIPGVELSADLESSGVNADIHLLGYGFDVTSAALQKQLGEYREGRIGRVHETVRILAAEGASISVERVFAIAGEASVGRPHVARALMEAGQVVSVQEAFDRWLGNGKVADVARPKLSPAAAIGMVHAAGGVVFAAHPVFIGANYEPVLAEMASWGADSIDGIETYYKNYDAETVAKHRALADRLGLATSGGSDYHGLGNPDDREIGDIPFPDMEVDRFVKFVEARCAHPGRAGAKT
ncbi:MAG: PHP domain-containing protein [Tepidiformaceae bacterium]